MKTTLTYNYMITNSGVATMEVLDSSYEFNSIHEAIENVKNEAGNLYELLTFEDNMLKSLIFKCNLVTELDDEMEFIIEANGKDVEVNCKYLHY